MNICVLHKKKIPKYIITYKFSKECVYMHRTQKNKYLYIFRVFLDKVLQNLNVFLFESIPVIPIFSQDVSQCLNGCGWGGRWRFHLGRMRTIQRRTGAHTMMLPECACKLNPIVMDKLIDYMHGIIFNRPGKKISHFYYKMDIYFRFDLNSQ